jgi:hypothetical protein
MSYPWETHSTSSPTSTAYTGFTLPTPDPYLSSSEPEFPSRWTIYPDTSNATVLASLPGCPTPQETFTGFIIANAVVTVVGVIIGCRPVLNKLTCNLLAKKGKKNTIRYNWIPTVVLQILANVVCGAIIHYTPGYEHVRVEDVMMLYLIRPRIALIATSTAAAFLILKDEYPWMYSLLANGITELILQIMAVCWVVATGHSGWNTTFLVITVFMFIGTGLTAIVAGLIIFMSRPYDATGGEVFNTTHWGNLQISNSFANRLYNWFQLMLFACPAYIVSWCFFGLLISGAKDQ